MIACGATSCDGLTTASRRRWGGFHGVPPVTSSRFRLNVQMGGDRGVDPGDCRAPTVCLAVHAHVVPDEVMTPAVLLGRDSWAEVPVLKYVDISELETVIFTITGRDSDATASTNRYSDWVNNVMGFVEPRTGGDVVTRFSGTRYHILNAMSWVTVSITNADGTAAAESSYYIRFNKRWSPREAAVCE